MWISTVTMDLNAFRALPEEEVKVLIKSILEKKNQLRTDPTVGGNSIQGFSTVESLDEISPTASNMVVKRRWNLQSVAQEFVDYINNLHGCISATLEEQV